MWTSLTLPTLRECVEKLELLKTPEEHQRRLLAIPEVHADPKMDPNYETDEDAGESDDKKQGYIILFLVTLFQFMGDLFSNLWVISFYWAQFERFAYC